MSLIKIEIFILMTEAKCTCPCCESDVSLIKPLLCECPRTCNHCATRKQHRKQALKKEGLEVTKYVFNIFVILIINL